MGISMTDVGEAFFVAGFFEPGDTKIRDEYSDLGVKSA
jgi:hypothetical protein